MSITLCPLFSLIKYRINSNINAIGSVGDKTIVIEWTKICEIKLKKIRYSNKGIPDKLINFVQPFHQNEFFQYGDMQLGGLLSYDLNYEAQELLYGKSLLQMDTSYGNGILVGDQ